MHYTRRISFVLLLTMLSSMAFKPCAANFRAKAFIGVGTSCLAQMLFHHFRKKHIATQEELEAILEIYQELQNEEALNPSENTTAKKEVLALEMEKFESLLKKQEIGKWSSLIGAVLCGSYGLYNTVMAFTGHGEEINKKRPRIPNKEKIRKPKEKNILQLKNRKKHTKLTFAKKPKRLRPRKRRRKNDTAIQELFGEE